MSNEKRAPLLSDDGYRSIIDGLAEDCGVDETGGGRWAYTCMSETARAIRNFYEDLITRGELRVVKTVGINALGECTECGWDADHRYPFSTCCPGCGNPIEQ